MKNNKQIIGFIVLYMIPTLIAYKIMGSLFFMPLSFLWFVFVFLLLFVDTPLERFAKDSLDERRVGMGLKQYEKFLKMNLVFLRFLRIRSVFIDDVGRRKRLKDCIELLELEMENIR